MSPVQDGFVCLYHGDHRLVIWLAGWRHPYFTYRHQTVKVPCNHPKSAQYAPALKDATFNRSLQAGVCVGSACVCLCVCVYYVSMCVGHITLSCAM